MFLYAGGDPDKSQNFMDFFFFHIDSTSSICVYMVSCKFPGLSRRVSEI